MKKGQQRINLALAQAFGERLHRYREDRGLSQRQLAQLAGVDPMQISRYERGQGLPAADTLALLAEALHLSADTLLFGKADRQRAPLKNALLLQRLQEIDALDRRDQQTIIDVIDSVLARRQIEAITATSRKRRSA
jgi:transcriptional regulator with XRE-family HTH domain